MNTYPEKEVLLYRSYEEFMQPNSNLIILMLQMAEKIQLRELCNSLDQI